MSEAAHGRVVVAVDGPAGSGKSSVSRAAAARLGYGYLDTGAAYRALAWFVTERGLEPSDGAAVATALPDFDYRIGTDPDGYRVRVGERDVTEEIRRPEVSAVVSLVARVPKVREHLTGLFRDLVARVEAPGVFVEGRDITTVVAPDADARVLLTASAGVRAARRAAELTGAAAEAAGESLHRRDAADSKVVDFMEAAAGVTTLDSTDLSFDATVDALVALARP